MSSENIDFIVKSSSDKKYTLSLPSSTRIEEVKTQLAQQSDIAADRQRLIFAGRVLKDNETLDFYKIKSGQTVHLVKGAAPPGSGNSSAASSSTTSSSAAVPQVPNNIAAGAGSGNVLADLTGARYAGLAQLPSTSMFGPDGGMGAGANAEQMLHLMEEPGFAQHMQQALQNPEVVDMMINSNPQLRQMGPQFRQILQSPEFVQMMSNPQTLRTMIQMEQMFNRTGGEGNTFPAPGDSTAGTTGAGTESTGTNPAGTGGAANPFAALFPAGQTPDAAAANPFAALLNPQRHANSAGAAGAGAGGAAGTNPSDPSAMFNPALLASLFGGANPAAIPEPQDDRPPEERYESQLRQLNELGFVDFDRNVRALRRSGGNVQGAIEALLDGQV